MGEPLLMSASLAMFGKGGAGYQVIMTPIMFAAWIGFLITFLNLLTSMAIRWRSHGKNITGSKDA